MGDQRDIVIIALEVEEGAPEEPLMPLLSLTIEDFKGKEIDPIMEQATSKFLDDENFVNSRAFIQFLWRSNIENFEEKCVQII